MSAGAPLQTRYVLIMKRTLLMLLVWASAGAGTVIGSVLGSRGGQQWLFAGAILGDVSP